jgi:hypothetical protein
MADNSQPQSLKFTFSLIRLKAECRVPPTFADFTPPFVYLAHNLVLSHLSDQSRLPSTEITAPTRLLLFFLPIKYSFYLARKLRALA